MRNYGNADLNKKLPTKPINNFKGETYETWKERKLIQEMHKKQQDLQNQKLKEKLRRNLENTRTAMNDLAVKTWKKKKAQLNKNNVPCPRSSVQHIQRGVANESPSVITKNELQSILKTIAEKVVQHKLADNMEKKDEKKKIIVEEDDEGYEDIKSISASETTSEEISDEDSSINIGSVSDFTISEESEDTDSSEHKSKKTAYIIKPKNYRQKRNLKLSERQYSNKLSFEEWLKKKEDELKEKKRIENLIKMKDEEDKKFKKYLSRKAVGEWHIISSFRTAVKDADANGLPRPRWKDVMRSWNS